MKQRIYGLHSVRRKFIYISKFKKNYITIFLYTVVITCEKNPYVKHDINNTNLVTKVKNETFIPLLKSFTSDSY